MEVAMIERETGVRRQTRVDTEAEAVERRNSMLAGHSRRVSFANGSISAVLSTDGSCEPHSHMSASGS